MIAIFWKQTSTNTVYETALELDVELYLQLCRSRDVLRPVNREESYQGQTKCIPTTKADLMQN